ncbi:MAG TPA: hypothetical protein ENG87_00065 [Candidatus Pacearchaeota archaeon]|nr:aspartoacylase [archaeon BMS3Abin17]HDK41745.1 hypothetical protein [Candidatus Pacearchaeota archaeon]HDZ60498.1 hypothetical protein [Candidatus Pacearchaeota archaeon]
MNVAIVCCLHGNERYGLEVVKGLLIPLPFFIGNIRALIENKRFIDCDLNRVFPGRQDGDYENRRAYKLVEKLSNFDYVLDLHSSSNHCPLFGIITRPNEEKINLAKKMKLKRLVIMPERVVGGKALIDFVKCGISLEIGPHNKKRNINEVVNVINNLFQEENKSSDLKIFEFIKKVDKNCEKVLIKNFEKVKKGQLIAEGSTGKKQFAEFDFIAVLVNEKAYKDLLCFGCKQVNLKIKKDYF